MKRSICDIEGYSGEELFWFRYRFGNAVSRRCYQNSMFPETPESRALQAVTLRDDRATVLQAVRVAGSILFCFPQWLHDKEMQLAAVSSERLALKHLPPEAQSARDVVLAALQCSGTALEYASRALQDNEVIVLAAIRKSPFAFKYASPRLRASEHIVLLALEKVKNMHFRAQDLESHPMSLTTAEVRENPQLMHSWLEIIWDNLFSGELVDDIAVDSMQRFCRPAMLRRLLNSRDLEQLDSCLERSHPVARIFGTDSDEYAQIRAHVGQLITERDYLANEYRFLGTDSETGYSSDESSVSSDTPFI